LLLQGVAINPWDIAQSLIVLMLVPLAIGLFMRSHSPDSAAHWQPVMNKISSLAILVLLVVGIGLNVSNIISLIGTGGILALLLFIVGSLLIGFVLGGREPATRSVMGLGTAQRIGGVGRDHAELRRNRHAAFCPGGGRPVTADLAADGETNGRQSRGGRPG
jgi:BASS family bile acid:Na+ symporter